MHPPIHILAVEDDEIDVELLQRNLQSQPLPVKLTVMRDALTALHYLQMQARQPLPDLPHLLLLDLNLPGMNGLTFLRTLRQDPVLQPIIVFVVTTSDLPRDQTAAYQAGIAGYVLKKNLPAFAPFLSTYCTLIEAPPFYG